MKLRLRSFLSLPTIGQLGAVPVEGNIIDGALGAAFLNNLANSAAPVTVPVRFSVVTNVTTGALALTPANCSEGILNAWVVASGGSANTNTTDTATAMIGTYWREGYVGAVTPVYIVNNNSGTMTLAGGVGVTISGTATIPTLALGMYRAKITNLATPVGALGSQTLQAGSVSTNSTTTTAATANNVGVNNPTSVINVASATGIATAAGASWLGVVNVDGTTSYYQVSSIATLAITVYGNINKNIANGAAVTVFNNTITITRMFSTVTAVTAA